MQQRRFRPGDVLDDYCPRERRITDHAVVAMIDDTIKQTRCCVCDAEHEFKDGKVPAQRRRKGQPALFSQVLDGLQGPHPARLSHPDAEPEPTPVSVAEISEPPPNSAAFEPLAATIVALPAVQSEVLEPSSGNGYPPIAPPTAMHSDATGAEDVQPPVEEGPVRRSCFAADRTGHMIANPRDATEARRSSAPGTGHTRIHDSSAQPESRPSRSPARWPHTRSR